MIYAGFIQTLKKALRLQRWPVLTPEELRKKEQQEKLMRLYGKAPSEQTKNLR
tara:strand:- start:68 stop:226 length:159 start_codon:yes stop_codon:yes gene_type:complete